MRDRAWIVAATTLVVLIVASNAHELLSRLSAYRQLHRAVPFYFVESIDKIGGGVLCVLAVLLLRRAGLRDAARELGLSAPVLPAIAFALGVSLPMLMGFLITRSLTPHLHLLPVLFLTFLSPSLRSWSSAVSAFGNFSGARPGPSGP